MKLALKIMGLLLLGVAAFLLVDRQLHLPEPPPNPDEIEALTRRRDELGAELRLSVAKAGEKSLGKAPEM